MERVDTLIGSGSAYAVSSAYGTSVKKEIHDKIIEEAVRLLNEKQKSKTKSLQKDLENRG